MADEIKIPLMLEPDPLTNSNGSRDYFTGGNNNPIWGWRFDNGVVTDYVFKAVEPIPATISGAPEGTIRLSWFTTSTDVANSCEFRGFASDSTANSTSWNLATFDDDDIAQTDVSNGALVENTLEITLSSVTQTVDRLIFGKLRRLGTTDSLSADVLVAQAWYVADAT
jgi:hypothetical protein